MNSEQNYLQFLSILSESKKNEHKFFDEKKQKEPIVKMGKNLWLFTRYEDINLILHDSNFLRLTDPSQNEVVRSILDLDFEAHMKYRKILNKVFNSSLIQSLKIDQKIYNNLQYYKNKETIDIVEDVAIPVPVSIMYEIFGAQTPSKEEVSLIKKWAGNVLMPIGISMNKESYKQFKSDIEAFSNYLINLIFSSKYEKKEGLINYLKSYSIDGKKLSNEEIFSLCALIFTAGFETTVGSITSSIFNIIEDQDIVKFKNLQISNNKIQISNELIRHSSSIRFASRRISEDYFFKQNLDKTILLPKGDHVILSLESGNRDSAIFKDPHTIILDRENSNKNLAFGAGAHYCLGANLAKAQVGSIVCNFFKNTNNLKIVGQPLRHPSQAINGFTELCVRVD
jgi:cytochrome P450